MQCLNWAESLQIYSFFQMAKGNINPQNFKNRRGRDQVQHFFFFFFSDEKTEKQQGLAIWLR